MPTYALPSSVAAIDNNSGPSWKSAGRLVLTAMAETSLGQLTLEPSSSTVNPDRLATDLFNLSLRIYNEIATNGKPYFDDDALFDLIERKDRFRLFRKDYDERDGCLDEIPVDEDVRESLLSTLCRVAKALVNLACLTNLKEALADVFQQIDELDRYVYGLYKEPDTDDEIGQPDNAPAAGTMDDSNSSKAEASSQKEVSNGLDQSTNVPPSKTVDGSSSPGPEASSQEEVSNRLDQSTNVPPAETVDDSSSSASEALSPWEASTIEEALEDLDAYSVALYRLSVILYDNAKAVGLT